MIYLFNLLYLFFAGNKKTPSAVFEIYKDNAGEYRFRLKASNGEIILISESYKTKQSANKGIRSVKINANNDQRYERKQARNSQFMFNLRAVNHQVIGTSEMYVSSIGRDNGIESVKANAPCADIRELT